MPSSDANVEGASACAANANLVVCSTSIDMLEKLVPSYLRAASNVSLTLSQTTHIFKKDLLNCVKRSRERAKNAQVSLAPTRAKRSRDVCIASLEAPSGAIVLRTVQREIKHNCNEIQNGNNTEASQCKLKPCISTKDRNMFLQAALVAEQHGEQPRWNNDERKIFE